MATAKTSIPRFENVIAKTTIASDQHTWREHASPFRLAGKVIAKLIFSH